MCKNIVRIYDMKRMDQDRKEIQEYEQNNNEYKIVLNFWKNDSSLE